MAEGDITQEIPHETQVTPAHVLDLIQNQVIPRLDSLEGTLNDHGQTLHELGLNGHTPLLKAFLEQYAATYTRRQAWITVWSDITYRLRWLSSPRSWVKATFYGFLGAVGIEIALGHFRIPHFGL